MSCDIARLLLIAPINEDNPKNVDTPKNVGNPENEDKIPPPPVKPHLNSLSLPGSPHLQDMEVPRHLWSKIRIFFRKKRFKYIFLKRFSGIVKIMFK